MLLAFDGGRWIKMLRSSYRAGHAPEYEEKMRKER
jgi:hypothetical protein